LAVRQRGEFFWTFYVAIGKEMGDVVVRVLALVDKLACPHALD